MARLIDADVVINDIQRNNKENFNRPDWTSRQVCALLREAPTVDALIPPCKPWDKVWIICKTLGENGGFKKTICEGEIFKLSYNGFTAPMEWLDYRWDSPLVGQTTSHDRIDMCLGNTVFLTREEAETALAKMDGGADDGR